MSYIFDIIFILIYVNKTPYPLCVSHEKVTTLLLLLRHENFPYFLYLKIYALGVFCLTCEDNSEGKPSR